MGTIVKVWFDNHRIFIETSNGNILSRPLAAFPLLLDANDAQRQNFKIGKFGDDIRWEAIDEDIHISSFFEEKEAQLDNPIMLAFQKLPQINISEFARQLGINKSLMAKYIYGIKTPSESRKKEIEKELHRIGQQLMEISF